jgi:hypothetical protein
MATRTVTAEEIKNWGVSTTVENAGRCYGLSRTQAYEAVKRGDIETFSIGRRIVVPTAPLRRKLGIDVDVADATDAVDTADTADATDEIEYPHNGMWSNIKRARTQLVRDLLRDHPELRDKPRDEVRPELERWAIQHGVDVTDWPYRMTVAATYRGHEWGAIKGVIRRCGAPETEPNEPPQLRAVSP